MNEEFILSQTNKKILANRPAAAEPIGRDVYNWLSKYTKNTKKNTSILTLLEQIVGSEMMIHCKADSIRGGVLKIKVRSGPYMFQMRNMSGEILRQLQTAYPSSNINEIKIIAG
ncbi:MAG: DUF721 domain-containing protein [Planctomycetaceae bacterium]|nr:DUF721 domain-containing protein [Planctomycetaceae bacterium]